MPVDRCGWDFAENLLLSTPYPCEVGRSEEQGRGSFGSLV